MKKLKIISRKEAMNRLTNSVFVSGGTLSPFPLSHEKYDWYGERAYIGLVLSVNNEVDCVYVEKQQDHENGVFCVFMCMMKSSRNEVVKMKELKIISKNEALGRLAKSIKSGTRLSPYPLNTQSYTWTDEKLYIGREVCVMDNVDCVYFERHQDHQNGIHGRIMCMRYDLDKQQCVPHVLSTL